MNCVVLEAGFSLLADFISKLKHVPNTHNNNNDHLIMVYNT